MKTVAEASRAMKRMDPFGLLTKKPPVPEPKSEQTPDKQVDRGIEVEVDDSESVSGDSVTATKGTKKFTCMRTFKLI